MFGVEICGECIFELVGSWRSLHKQLVADGHTLVAVERNLIDAVWDNPPPFPHNPVFIQPLHFAGELDPPVFMCLHQLLGPSIICSFHLQWLELVVIVSFI